MRRLGVAIAVLAAWLATATAVGPPAPRAHPPSKPARIGYLGYTTPEVGAQYLAAFRERLAELGLADGTDVVLTARYAAGRYDRLTALAAELVRSRVDVLVTPGSEATVAATRATSTVPIVMLEVGDPVVHGLVASLLRPGGNVTGVSGIFSDLAPVHLELLRLAVPGASRVAVLWNPDNVAEHRLWTEKQTTARVFGWQLVTAPHEPDGRRGDRPAPRAGPARRCALLARRSADPVRAPADRQLRAAAPAADPVRLAGVRGRRRLHGLRSQRR